MAGFKLESFRGIRPRASKRLLPEGEAQTAENTRLGSGDLEPWAAKSLVQATCDPPNTETIYRYNNAGSPVWFGWSADVDVAPAPILNDTVERVFYTDGVKPKYTYTTIASPGAGCLPDDWRYLGVPAPAAAASVDPTDLPEVDAATGGPATYTANAGQVNTLQIAEVTPEDSARVATIPTEHPDFTGLDAVEWTVITDTHAFTTNVDDAATTWEPYSDAFSVEFGDFSPGLQLEVAEVVDANTVKFKAADGTGYIVESRWNDLTPVFDNADQWFDLHKSSDQTRDWYQMIDDGAVKLAYKTGNGSGTESIMAGFRLPNGTQFTIADHGLRVGDVITVASVPVPLRIALPPTDEVNRVLKLYPIGTWEWDEPKVIVYQNLYICKYYQTDVSIGLDASAATAMTIQGSFTYQVDRTASEESFVEERTYTYTFVSGLGEEGPPAPAATIFSTLDGDSATLTGFSTPPTTGYDITNIRIYRSNTGSTDTAFQFVAEIAFDAGTYADTTVSVNLGEALATTSWDPPPAELRGVRSLSNGVLVGFKGRTLHMSEPYYPHAWPTDYQQATDADIVGLGVFGSAVAVLTEGQPFVAIGSHPRNIDLRRIQMNQACVSKRSIAESLDKVYYASPDGLVAIGVNGAEIVTAPYVTKREWASYAPTTMIGEFIDGRYVGFFDDGAGNAGHIVFDPADPTIGLSTGTETAVAVYRDVETDALYLTDGSSIYQWDAGSTNQTATWKSRVIRVQRPLNPGAARVVADAYPVTFKLYAEGSLKITKTVNDDEPFRLPGGYLADTFEVELVTTKRIRFVQVAETLYELAEG